MSVDEKHHGTHFHEATFIDENGETKTTKIPVVQELARQLGLMNHFPKRFMASHLGQHPADPAKTITPPLIDIAKLQHNCSRKAELRRLSKAAKESGVFLIKNHGVDDMLLDDVKDVIKGFFGLSFEDKKLSVGSYESIDNMGYGKNFVKSEDQVLDWIDRLTMKAVGY